MADELAGQVAIVTGGGRGFGAAISRALARNGARVVLVARTKAQIESIASEIIEEGREACAAEADVTDRAQVLAAVALAQKQFGPVSLLVSNAGVAGPYGPIGAIDPDAWWRAQVVHLYAPLLFVSALLPGMRERRAGRIIVVAAIAGKLVTPHLSAYGMGKASQIRLVEQIHAENLDYGLSAFAIEPGTAITELAEGTIASSEAQRWLPAMVQRLTEMRREQTDSALAFARCGEMCTALASGRYDALSGRYLEPTDDFDELLRAVTQIG